MMKSHSMDGGDLPMETGRTILHSDFSAFYDSVEMMLESNSLGKAVVVCRSTEDRQGSVLAKSD